MIPRLSVVLVVSLFMFAAACASVPSSPDYDKKSMAEAHYKLGLAYLAEDNLQPAFIEFQKAVGLNPDNKICWNLLGYIHTRLEQYQQAEDSFRQALAIDDAYSDAHNNLGVLYNHQSRWDEAIREFERALENPLYETPQKALNNMGFAYMKRGDLQAAKNAFQQALLRGTIPQAHYNLAMVMLELGQDDQAVAELNAALRDMPTYVEAHWLLAQHFLDTKNPEDAIPHLEAVVQQIPNEERGRTAQRYLNLIQRSETGAQPRPTRWFKRGENSGY